MKGRGAAHNPPARFVQTHVETVEDGWYQDEVPASLATQVRPEHARTIISRNDSPDIPFEQSINPYRGCEHGCVYCYARPSHAYVDLSPGLDFETRLFYKADAAALLESELAAARYRVKPITLGANTDPYQPIERELGVTRSLLEVLARTHHPLTIITKGTLILRDLPLLRALAREELVHVFVSLTTLDPQLKRTLEPRAAAPAARLRVIQTLAQAGVPTGALIAPVIPAINDAELEQLVEAAAGAGARHAGYVLLRLPHELSDLFRDWLERHYPQRAAHVMSLVRAARGGRDNDSSFGQRMSGTGAWAELLRERFALAMRRHALSRTSLPPLNCARFEAPRAAREHAGGQLPLL